MRPLRLRALWARAARPGGPLSQMWRAAEGEEVTPDGAKYCAQPRCDMPAEVYGTFTLMGHTSVDGEDRRETVLFARVRCFGGHFYTEDTGMALPYEGDERF
jgi:hypothetical protein